MAKKGQGHQSRPDRCNVEYRGASKRRQVQANKRAQRRRKRDNEGNPRKGW